MTNEGRSGGAFLFDSYPSGPRTGFADDPLAAHADAAGTAAPHASLLDGHGRAVVVDRKAFSEIHPKIPRFARFLKVNGTLSTAG